MITGQNLSLDNLVFQSEGNIVSDMGGEKVMLSVQNGKYYNLGDIGGEIWDQLDNPISVKDLVESILDKYDVSHEECQKQVVSFLEQLGREKLIQIK